MFASSKTTLTALAAIGLSAALTVPALAGGLFGDGGLIRGDIGGFLDKYVEHPILTPVAQGAVIVTGYALGDFVGGPLGGVIGAGLGEAINDAAAGGGQQVAAIETGSTCTSDIVGGFPLGQPMPLGANCSVKFENGKDFAGTVTK